MNNSELWSTLRTSLQSVVGLRLINYETDGVGGCIIYLTEDDNDITIEIMVRYDPIRELMFVYRNWNHRLNWRNIASDQYVIVSVHEGVSQINDITLQVVGVFREQAAKMLQKTPSKLTSKSVSVSFDGLNTSQVRRMLDIANE